MGIDIKKNKFFLISIGAIPGALLRWQIDEVFIVNLTGCFLLGFLNSSTTLKKYKLTLAVGLCGSMTTFSGLSSHLYQLLSKGLYKLLLFDSISIVLIGVFAISLGNFFAKKINI
tara:strand:- start:189 stop:533 length:345 start_codon:yes stop_codon:yes gene_type:complete